jgi:membrane associated rhomboid family serine protease
MELRRPSEPIINAPAALLVLIALTVLAFVIMQFVPSAMREQLVLYFALFPARYAASADGVNWIFPGGFAADLWTLFTYVFLHGSWSHLIVNTVWLLAFGAPVARRLGSVRFILFYFICGLAGALAHLALHAGELVPVVGASAAVAGLMAGAARFVFIGGPGGFATERQVSRADASIRAALKNRNVLIFVGVWIGLNFLFGPTGISPTGEAADIAWEAHLGGFFAGLLLFGLFDPIQASASGGPRNVDYGQWRGRQD